MKKEFDLNSVKVFDLIRPEARVWIGLEKALEAEGVRIDSGLIEKIIGFAQAVVQFKNWKKIRSKRDWENDLKFRLTTIRRLAKQLEKDAPVIDDMLGNEFLDRQLYFALVEKATLIFESSQGKDLRDLSSVDLALYQLLVILKEQKVSKPAETLTAALERSGVVKDFTRAGWSVRTLQNKMSRVSTSKPMKKRRRGDPPMKLATSYLQKELPEHSKRVAELSRSLSEMKDPDLYAIVPVSSKFIFPNLF